MTDRLPPNARHLIAKMEADARFIATVIFIAIVVVSLWFMATWGGGYMSSPVTTAALKSDRL